MKQVALSVESRTEVGKVSNKVLRAAGKIPGVVYHRGEKTQAVALSAKELDQILHSGSGQNALINLTVKNEPARKDPRLVVLKEIQTHPVSRSPLHVDFHQISLTEKIRFTVQVVLKGEAVGVKADGGVLEAPIRELSIRCLVTQLPEHIDVDVTALKLNHSIHVEDLKLPQGIECLNDPHAVVAHVAAPFVEKTPEEGAAALTEPERIEKAKKEAEGEDGKAVAKPGEAKPAAGANPADGDGKSKAGAKPEEKKK